MKQYSYLLLLLCSNVCAMHRGARYLLPRQSAVFSAVRPVVRSYAVKLDELQGLEGRVKTLEGLCWGTDEDRVSKALHSMSITLANMHQQQVRFAKTYEDTERKRLEQAQFTTKIYGGLGAAGLLALCVHLGTVQKEQEES